jgi:hypothetical protein
MVLLASAEYGHSVTCCTAEHASCYLLHGWMFLMFLLYWVLVLLSRLALFMHISYEGSVREVISMDWIQNLIPAWPWNSISITSPNDCCVLSE